MNSFTIYLLKVCFGISLFVIPYFFLLRNDTNLRLKRFFLLGGIVLSYILPFLPLKRPAIITINSLLMTGSVIEDPINTVTTAGSAVSTAINWPTIIQALYLCGALLLLFRNIFLLIKWNAVWNRAGRKNKGVAYSGNDEILAIFSRIFLPDRLQDSIEIDSILLHEKAHIRQMHFIDLVFMEVVLLITWFNPFTWLMAAMVKENHEHLADRAVLAKGIDPAGYRLQLLNQSLGIQVFGLAQQFSRSLTKNRFAMMKRSGSIRSGLVKIAILLPLVFVALGFTVSKNRQANSISGKVVFSDTGKPASGTNIVIAGTTTGCVTDKEGNYTLELKEKARVVFSYVGYKTQSYWFNPGEYRFVVLEREILGVNSDNPGEKVKAYEKEKNAVKRVQADTTKKVISGKLFVAEETPKFNGGDPSIEFRKYIDENMKYPQTAKEKGISGRVIVQFVVDTTGRVTDAVAPVSVDPELDREALRVVMSSPLWTPGKQRGKNVKVFYTFPVNFNLSGVGGQKSTTENELSSVLKIKTEKGKPLILIDGVESDISDIDPYQIASISILKDSSATAVFGTRVANGVILITTTDKNQKKSNKTNSDSTNNSKTDSIKVVGFGKAVFNAQEPPKFNGGNPAVEFPKYIDKNMKYPQTAKEKGISGKVIVKFVVDTTGKVSDPVIAGSVDPALDKEALRVIMSSPAWTPYKYNGKPVKIFYTLAVEFKPEPKPAYYKVDRMAEYKGGIDEFYRFIVENIKYPKIAADSKVTGEIMVNFVINENGVISNIEDYYIIDKLENSPKVLKEIAVNAYSKPLEKIDQVSKNAGKYLIESEAYKVVLRSPGWIKPAIKDNKPVASVMRIPIKFILQ